jgi:hypothetical protein
MAHLVRSSFPPIGHFFWGRAIMAELVVTMDGVETQHVNLQKHRTTLGRKHHNDIVLADLSVSGAHCVFEREGPAEVWVKDMGSTNGTYINGERVQRKRLDDQDVVSLGVYLIRYLGRPAAVEVGLTAPMRLEDLGAPGSDGALHASLRVLEGKSAGLEMPLVKTVTTFGQPGDAVVAVYHRRYGYFIALVEGGERPAFHNGQAIGADARLLADQDIVELAGSKIQFLLG